MNSRSRRLLPLCVLFLGVATAANAEDCEPQDVATQLAAKIASSQPCWDAAAQAPPLGTGTLAAGGPAHVHLMHLDGFRPDLFEQLMDAGQLPTFAFLASRGQVSYDTSTVDKSETMKVIPAYLASKRDTKIVGWWQFNRESFETDGRYYSLFENYWLRPADVVRYAIGTDLVEHPTILDYVSARGGNPLGGFSLHRRGVDCKNYTRAYQEGAEAAVVNKTYVKQADATMDGIRNRFHAIATGGEPLPRLSTSLLAPADEFSHYEGIVLSKVGGEFALPPGVSVDGADKPGEGAWMTACFTRGSPPHERMFELMDADPSAAAKYFTNVQRAQGKVTRLCMRVPALEVHSTPQRPGAASSRGPSDWAFATPDYALGMIAVDIEVAKLIQTMRSIKCDGGKLAVHPAPSDVGSHLPGEDSLFDRTAFLFFGDHGMVDSKHKMQPLDPAHPDNFRTGGLDQHFVDALNTDLGLTSPRATGDLGRHTKIGITLDNLPDRLKYPHKHTRWQNFFVRRELDTIREDAQRLADIAKQWVGLGADVLGKPREPLEAKAQMVVDTFMEMRLRQEPKYLEIVRKADRRYFDQHVGLVYGGGARNNAEIFIPAASHLHRFRKGGLVPKDLWDRRPDLERILGYRPGGPDGKPLMDAIHDNPGVGLIFIRENNEDFKDTEPLPDRTDIRVSDRAGNVGRISVWRNAPGEELQFKYENLAGSGDPLGYTGLSGKTGTYSWWNQQSVDARHYYHNAVAGMGSYLYSNNAGIGDITLMHAQGWNFGGNAAGHGGLHRGEKITLMMASGAGVTPGGTLTATARFTVDASGQLIEQPFDTAPTLLDLAPTALDLLGVTPEDFAAFAADEFKPYLHDWKKRQPADLLACATPKELAELAVQAGIDPTHPAAAKAQLEAWLTRQLDAMTGDPDGVPDFDSTYRMDGNLLNLKR